MNTHLRADQRAFRRTRGSKSIQRHVDAIARHIERLGLAIAKPRKAADGFHRCVACDLVLLSHRLKNLTRAKLRVIGWPTRNI